MKLVKICENAYRNMNNAFALNNVGQCRDMYMKSDILLLAYIFEQFCKSCIDNYGLNANDYVSAASLSWDGMLKYTCVMLELLSEVDFLSFCALGLRGGI